MSSPRHRTTMENLPVEVLSDIFIRLLAKQLAQMRCVCKPWNALLSESSFIKSHLHRSIHNNDEILFLFHEGFPFEYRLFRARPTHSPDSKPTNLIKLPIKPQPKHTYGKIIGSVNGLICFCYGSYSLLHNNCVVYIWNPSLSVVLTLPPSPFPVNGLSKIHLRFGYDSKTDDYKVVKLTFVFGPPRMVPQVEVYRMRKGSWELISPQGFPCHAALIRHSDEFCVVDNVHWFCYTDLALKSQKMVAFDLSAETFREIPLPDPMLDYYMNALGVLSGKLCVISCLEGGQCEVWVMDEYGMAESWVKHHASSQFGGDIFPYGFTSHGEFLFRVDKNDNRFALYDPVTANTKTFKIKGVFGVNKVVEYVDSLVWVAPTQREMSCHSISQF